MGGVVVGSLEMMQFGEFVGGIKARKKWKKRKGGADLKVRYAPQVAFEIINYLQRKVVII